MGCTGGRQIFTLLQEPIHLVIGTPTSVILITVSVRLFVSPHIEDLRDGDAIVSAVLAHSDNVRSPLEALHDCTADDRGPTVDGHLVNHGNCEYDLRIRRADRLDFVIDSPLLDLLVHVWGLREPSDKEHILVVSAQLHLRVYISCYEHDHEPSAPLSCLD